MLHCSLAEPWDSHRLPAGVGVSFSGDIQDLPRYLPVQPAVGILLRGVGLHDLYRPLPVPAVLYWSKGWRANCGEPFGSDCLGDVSEH